MEVNPEIPFRTTLAGREYLFCSGHCLAEFDPHPGQYLESIPIAAGVPYLWFGHLAQPIIAAAAMSFASVSVITNALRLRRAQL